MSQVYQPFFGATKWRLITDGDINIRSKEITTPKKEIFYFKTVQTKS